MTRAIPWALDELENLKALALSGSYTEVEIAEKLERPRSSVRNRLIAYGITPKRLRPSLDLKSAIKRLYDDGTAPSKIPALTGASTFYVEYVLSLHRVGRTDYKPGGDHRKHILAVADSSAGRGFPYCMAPTRIPILKSMPVDKCNPGQIAQLSDPPKQRIFGS